MTQPSAEIVCTACGKETLVRREAVFDGFRKTGERFICISCGHAYADEAAVPFKIRRAASLFTEADRSKQVEIFRSDEKGHNCRHCRHYVKNPFIQRCALHNREVEATDLCDQFDPKPKLPGEET